MTRHAHPHVTSWIASAALALALGACGDDGDSGPTDATTTTATDTATGDTTTADTVDDTSATTTTADTADDATTRDDGDASGEITATAAPEDDTVDLSTVVTIAAAAISGAPGWMVIHEDDGAGGVGGVIGAAPMSEGSHTDLAVTLDRRAVDGETLFAMVHVDDGTVGAYEFGDGSGADGPVVVGGEVVVEPFVVTVPDGAPAVRATAGANGTSAYSFIEITPASYADHFGGGGDNPDLALRLGWRYEIINPDPSFHPFEFRDGPTGSTVLLSQSIEGDLEGDGTIDWQDDGTIRFTASQAFADDVGGYRCRSHAGMNGDVTVVTP